MIKKVSIIVLVGSILLVVLSTLTSKEVEDISADCEKVLEYYNDIESSLGAEHDEIVTFMAVVLYAERTDLEKTFDEVEEGIERVLQACS